MDYLNRKKEKKRMDNRVTSFLMKVMNGTETDVAIKESGVDELTTNEVLTEIAGVWNKNTLEAMVNFQKWVDTSSKMLSALQILKKNNDSVKELDKSLTDLEK